MLKQLKYRLELLKRVLLKKKNPLFKFIAYVQHIRNGKVVYRGWVERYFNGWNDDGERNILECYFRNENNPTNFYVGLGTNNGTPIELPENATLSSVNENLGTGYSRQLVERSSVGWPIIQQDALGNWFVISKQISFINTGTTNWNPIDYMFLTDVASGTTGRLLGTVAMDFSRVLSPNDQLNVQFSFTVL